MATSNDLLEGVEFSGPSSDLLEGVQAGGEPYQPRRDVGFMETAGRTAAMAASPVVRAIDMAAASVAGVLERLNIPSNLGGRGVGVVRPQPGAPVFPGLAGEQDRVFQQMQQRQTRLQEAYAPQPGEQMGVAGQLAGGLASLPVEMLGGFGALHGIERSAQVLERGGTGQQAALAGGVTGATRVGLNALPIKLGGKIGGAVEGKLGAMLGGGVTGAAVNVPGEAIGTAAENLALPAAEDATVLQRARGKGLAPGMEDLGQDPLDLTNLAASAGLSGGMGAVGGAMAKKTPKKAATPPIPDGFTPQEDGSFKAPNGATVTKEQWDNASDRLRQGWLKKPEPKAPDEKIPTGETKEVEIPTLTDAVDALPPESDRARRAEIERLMGETNSAEVKATLKQELGKLDKAQKGRETGAKKAADKAELLAAAAKSEDPEVKKALLARAEKVLPTEKVPTGEAKEVDVETIEAAPEPIPTGEATEVPVETVEPAAPRETAAPQQGAPDEATVEKVAPEAPAKAVPEAPVTPAVPAPAGPAADSLGAGKPAAPADAGVRPEVAPEGSTEGSQAPRGRGRELAPNEVEVQAVAGAVDPRAVRELGRRGGPVTVGKLKIPRKPVDSPEAAAQVLAPMRRDTQEQFLALVTDKDGKPLAVLRHSKGGPSETSVYFNALIPQVAQVKGAANVWFAHNHPSGNVRPSEADVRLQTGLQEILRDSGVQVKSHTIIGPGGKVTHFGTNPDGSVAGIQSSRKITPALRKDEVPIQEGRVTRVDPGKEPVIESPSGAKDAIEKHFKPEETGIVLLDSQMRPQGVLHMDQAEMAKLRTGDTSSGLMRAMRAFGDTTARFAVIKAGPDREGWKAAKNLRAALAAVQIEVPDIMQHDGGGLKSSAEGNLLGAPGKTFESLDRTRLSRIAIDRAIARDRGNDPAPLKPVQTGRRLEKALEKYEKGTKRDDRANAGEALAKEIERLAEEVALRNLDRQFNVRPRERGADYVRQRLLEAKRRGDISDEAADFADWFIRNNPSLVDDLAIGVRTPPEGSTSAGLYNPINRLVTLFKGTDQTQTAVHEVLHHLERLMTPELQAGVRKAYWRDHAAEVRKAIKDSNDNMLDYLRQVMVANTDSSPREARAAANKAMGLLTGGKVPYEAYALFNPSEYWAVRMADRNFMRYQAQDSIWQRTKEWLREALEHVKGALGIRSQAPMLRALNDLMSTEFGPSADGAPARRSPGMLAQKEGEYLSPQVPRGWDVAESNHLKSDEELDQVLRSKFGAKLIDALQEQGILHYLEGAKDAPDRPFTKGRLIERSDDTTHARLYWDRMTADEAPTVLMHEIGEHFGIVRLLGDDRYRALLTELADMNRSGDAEVRRAWQTVKQRYVGASYLEEGSPQFVREVAARLVESAPDMPWVRRLLAEIRAWMYQQFGTTLATRADANLIRGLAWSALKKAGDGELPRQDRFVYPDFMRSKQPVAEMESEMVGQPSYGGRPPRPEPLGDEPLAELVTRKLFDRFNRVLKVQKAAGIADEDKDIYLADTLYQGRVQHEGDKLQRDYVEPLAKLLKEAKQEDLSVKDADDYLMALHAPERNRVIAARNDKMPDGGSGLTDQQAADIIASFTTAQRDYLDRVATIVHRLNREKLQRMVETGLITPETRDMLNRQYRNYVPLKTLDEEDAAMGTGRGYELRASDITTAMGRSSKAGSPIAASIMDASRTIIRGEKARVDRTIWNFANDAAADPFMRPYDPDNPPATVMSRTIGPDGKVKDVVDTQKVLDQTISLMVDGERQRIFVDDELLRDQIRKVATLNDPGPELRAIGRGTGAIGRMLTEFNPAFTIPNAVRDAWTVGLRAPAHGISRWKAVGGIPKAWGSIISYKRGANTPGAKAYEEFQRVGGKIGAYGIQDVADTMRRLEKAGAELGYDEQKGGLTRKGMNVLRDVAFVFSQANEVFEYATRLSAYEQARAAGHSEKRSAAIAKDITVNFNRAGEYGRVMNSLLVFANAALQGLYGTLRYARDPKVQRGMLSIVALGIASQAWNELMGGVNEETGEPNANTQNDSVMDKNLVAMLPDSKEGFKLPLPQEYAALYAMGRRLYRGASQGDWGREAGGIAGALVDAALPVRIGEGSSAALAGAKALVPTLAAPFADLWTNENHFGAPIYAEQRDTTSPAPYHTLTRPQTSVLTKEVGEMLNTVTGGDEVEPGWAQRAGGPLVSPEGIEHLVGFYTGGAGQFLLQSANLAKAATGDTKAVELNRTPIVNRFIFNEPTSYIGRRYRELEGKLEYARDREKAGQEVTDERLARTLPVFEEAERELSRLRKEIRAAANAGEPLDELRQQARAAQSRVIRAFNGQALQ